MSGTRTEPTVAPSTNLDTTTADAAALDRATQHQREQPPLTEETQAPRERVISRREQAMQEIFAKSAHQREARDIVDQQIIDTSMSPEDREIAAQERAEAQRALTDINARESARAEESIARRQAANTTNTNKQVGNRNVVIPGAIDVAGQPTRFPVTVNGKVIHLTEAEIAGLVNVGAQTVEAQQRGVQPTQTQPVQQPAPQQVQAQPSIGLPANWRPPTVNDVSADRLLKQLSYGKDEDAKLAIKDIIATAVMISAIEWNKALPGLVAAIKEQTKQEMRAEVEYNNMLSILANEFGDVFQSELKSKAAGLALIDIRARNQALGTQMSELDASREALTRVRQEFGGGNVQISNNQNQAVTTQQNQPNAQANRVSINSNRIDRKRAAPTMPNAAGKGNVAEQVSGPITRSDIVNAMRKARGQSVIN